MCGFVAFLDPPDPTANDAVAALAGSGVAMKILTGDGELVARTICAEVGLRTDRVLLGIDVEAMNDDALGAVVEQVDVFARVSPAQKNRIIRALKRRRHVVGYIGVGRYTVQPLSPADVTLSCGITGGSKASPNGTAAFNLVRTVAGVVTPGTVSGIVVVPADSVELRNGCISESAGRVAVDGPGNVGGACRRHTVVQSALAQAEGRRSAALPAASVIR